jgi:hypothetical protein
MTVDVNKLKEEGFKPITSGFASINEKEYFDVQNAINSIASFTEDERLVLKQVNYEHHVGHHWSVSYGYRGTAYVMTMLGISRKKADMLLMVVLKVLDRKYGYV